MGNSFFREELLIMRENYKNNPLEDIKLGCPSWLDSTDPMYEMYEKKREILKNGEITYAHIVQANMELYKRVSFYNCPAHIVYSDSEYVIDNIELLEDVAFEIGNYKDRDERDVPLEWREIARVVTDEYDRADFSFPIYHDGNEIIYNFLPTMIHRKLLPKRRLCGSIIPILVTKESKQVMILPKKYWSNEFKKLWVNGLI